MLESPAVTPELRAQAAAVTVVATCSCGCPSIGLGVPDEIAGAGVFRSIEADGSAPDGRPMRVSLHLPAGRLAELELWAGGLGDDPRAGLPVPGSIVLGRR